GLAAVLHDSGDHRGDFGLRGLEILKPQRCVGGPRRPDGGVRRPFGGLSSHAFSSCAESVSSAPLPFDPSPGNAVPLKPCATTYHSDESLRLAGGFECFTVRKLRFSSATSAWSAPPASTLATNVPPGARIS